MTVIGKHPPHCGRPTNVSQDEKWLFYRKQGITSGAGVKWCVQTAFRYACGHNSLFPKSHTLFVSHFKPRWRSVERWLTVVMKSPLLPMDEFILCVCLFVHVYICACTSVWCIASDPYSPGVTRDQLCRLIDVKSTSQTKYVGHFSHISAISCTHISTTSDDLMFAVDKLKKNAYKTMFFKKERQFK